MIVVVSMAVSVVSAAGACTALVVGRLGRCARRLAWACAWTLATCLLIYARSPQ